MFHCTLCNHKLKTLDSYLDHRRINHINVSKLFFCGYQQCSSKFQNEANLRNHVSLCHQVPSESAVPERRYGVSTNSANTEGKFRCTFQICSQEFDNYSSVVKHLRKHIANGEKVKWPHNFCPRTYDKLNSFSSHLTKKHKGIILNASEQDDIPRDADKESSDKDSDVTFGIQTNDLHNNHYINDHCSSDAQEPNNDVNNDQNVIDIEKFEDNLFLHSIAQFYLQLESQFFSPISTINHIVANMKSLYIHAQQKTKTKLKASLLSRSIPIYDVNRIITETFDDDIFLKSHASFETDYKRKEFYKKKFPFIQPISLTINKKKKTVFHYVDIKKTLELFFSDKSLENEIPLESTDTDPNIFSDFYDGSEYRENVFFKQNLKSLKIIIFQDAFEIVNPLGAAKRKHKLLGIYMTLGNLPDHLRTHTNCIKLVALCKEKEFEHDPVYGKIVADLKLIEEKGILISGEFIKGAVVFIAGDNLGSHGLGGFVENFSKASFFCRYCLISMDEMHQKNGSFQVHPPRTVESYTKALEKIETKKDYEGIKFDSVFNRLSYYHVCSPGLPPCLGHDLHEGVIAFDMYLFIQQLIKQKWFTLEEINDLIDSFPYSQKDIRDKPVKLSTTSNRITGGAMQIKNMLRLFPLMVEEKIVDINDEIWICIVTLNEITDMICSPSIHKRLLPYLQDKIEDYLILRQKLFPEKKLRPKHHYLSHYVELILKYGPLMKVWTMRFESKHTFFKRVTRILKCYKNVVKSLSEKHELYQSYLRIGADIRCEQECHEITDLELYHYNAEIVTCIKHLNLTKKAQQCNKVTIKGTIYGKGCILALRQKGYCYNVVFGKISNFFFDERQIVYALFEIKKCQYIPHICAYEISDTESFECHKLTKLSNYKPMHIYYMKNRVCVRPDHSFVTEFSN